MASFIFPSLLGLSVIFLHLVAAEINPQKLKHNYENGTKMLKSLLSNYDKRLRPYHSEQTLYITISAEVVSFKELDELGMQFGMDMFFRQNWHDPRLAHNVGSSILLPGEQRKHIWLPDTFFFNIKEAKHHTVPEDNSRLEIQKDGSISYSSRITMSSSCNMDFREYPMDAQNCSWEVLSYSFRNNEVDYYWGNKSLIIFDDSMAQFSLQGFTTKRTVHHYTSGSYTHLVAQFVFHRRLAYSFIQIYIPTAMVVGLSYLSFWVQKSAVPARVALGITTVLTLVTLMGSLRASVPKVSYIKAIDWYLLVGFIFIFGALLEYVLVLSRAEKSEDKKELDEEQGVSTKLLEEVPKTSESDPNTITIEEVNARTEEVTIQRAILNWCKEKTISRLAKPCKTTTQTVDICDRICRILYPLVFLLFNIIYWSVYAL